jgi:hypothetical protein
MTDENEIAAEFRYEDVEAFLERLAHVTEDQWREVYARYARSKSENG